MAHKMPFMPLWIDHYQADTFSLTTEQHGAYLLLLMAMWKSGGRLPRQDSTLAHIAKLSVCRWKRLSGDILPYFSDDGTHLTHKRISEEISLVFARSASASSSAKARWKKSKKANQNKESGHPSAYAPAMRSDMQSQSVRNATYTSSSKEEEVEDGWKLNAGVAALNAAPPPPSSEAV